MDDFAKQYQLQVAASRSTQRLLEAFDAGDLDEQGLSWLLALHTLDYLELSRKNPLV